MNPKQLEKMAKKMGMQMDNIDAIEVIIKTADKEIVISNPQVSKVNMMGQETFQISGDVSEKSKQPFTGDDVVMVVSQTGATEEEAKRALGDTNGDLAEAIMMLKKPKD